MDPDEFPELQNHITTEETSRILRSEMRRAIQTLPTGKAPGIDNIPGELLKGGGETIVSWLNKIFQNILDGGPIPKDLRTGQIIPIHKKGDVTMCNNYRPITLLSHTYKGLATFLRNRVKTKEEEQLSENQAGFRPGRGTADQIFTLRQIAEKRWEHGKDLFCVFIDFKQAFDSVWRECMLAVLIYKT